jgi:hypothetical protein
MGDIPLSEGTVAEMQGGSASEHFVKDANGNYMFTPERQALHDKIIKESYKVDCKHSTSQTLMLNDGWFEDDKTNDHRRAARCLVAEDGGTPPQRGNGQSRQFNPATDE